MARRSSPCTQGDITRLIKAAVAAGIGVERITGVKLTREGAVLLFGDQRLAQEIDVPTNEWDQVLDHK
jgi:hypothetical protein